MNREKQIEERLKEKCDLADVIDYAGRDWDNYRDECYEEGIQPQDSYDDFVADAVLAAGYRKQCEGEWISVDERLPDSDGDFLVWNDYNRAIVGHYWARGKYFISKAVTVTHWMPLPEPPKMKGGTE